MSIEGIKPALIKGFPSVEELTKAAPQKETESAKGKSFGQMFTEAIQEVDNLQKTADAQVEGIITGQDGVTPHGAMLALEKADVAFQLMSTIRSKIVRAYEDVLRTQV